MGETKMVRLRKKQRIICAIVGALIIYEVVKKHKKRKKRWWTRPWAREERRQAQGFAENLVKELRSTDTEAFSIPQSFQKCGCRSIRPYNACCGRHLCLTRVQQRPGNHCHVATDATFSVTSNLHEQFFVCDNFYLSHKS